MTQKKGKLSYFGKYPLKTSNSNNLNLGDACSGPIVLTPDKKHLVIATSKFGYLSCYRVNKEETELFWELWLSKSEYKMDGQRTIFSPQNEIGTMSMALSNDKIFLLYQGEEFRYYTSMDPQYSPRTVMVFSMEGQPLAKYHLDRPATRIAVDLNENIYCITKDPEYNLVKLKIE
ncbi:MAG: BF3164 family lipoprotein [Mangrovibacterium sp.]